MEEEDIYALSRWHGEPNFQEDCFQNTATDRILANCFTESFRIQNLFNTKARPRMPQFNIPQPEPEVKINVYVPGGRISFESSPGSQLYAKEQKEYLRLYLACKYNGKNSLQKQEEAMFTLLHQKVIEENVQYEEFVQDMWSKTEHTFSLQDSIRRYTSEAWQFRLAEVCGYPELFKVIATLPLVSSLDASLVKMKLERTVLEVGEAPCIFPPQFQSKLCCSGEYSNMCSDYPVPQCVRKMCPVSKDSTAEKLALAHNADIVISSSALQHIVDNYPNYDKVWDIPVVIKQFEQKEGSGLAETFADRNTVLDNGRNVSVHWSNNGSGNMKKILFIDKALPPTTLTAEQRNFWFHKIAVKKLFCRQDNGSTKTPAKRPRYVAKKRNANHANNRVQLRQSVRKGDNSLGLSETTNCASEDDDVEEKEDTTLSNDLDVLTLNSDDGLSQCGVKRKPVDTPVSSVTESDCNDESGGTSSDDNGRLMIACDEGSEEWVKEGENVQRTKKKRKLNSNGSSNPLPTKNDKKDETVLGKPSDENCSHTHQEDESVESLCAQQKDEPMSSSLMKHSSQYSVVYNMWQICLQEAEKEDLKERILKNKVENKHLRVLVRCKVDGVKNAGIESQKLCIVPKLEHKLQFGAEKLSTSEMFKSWVTLFFRPGVNLARVRVDAKTSEVLMFEETNLKELLDYASFSKVPVQSMALGTLYNVLTALDSYGPGTYLMSHRRDSFFNFLKADDENGRHSLKTVYKINCNEVSTTRRCEYLPIDPSVLMPRNLICGRVPGTFKPKKLPQTGQKKRIRKPRIRKK